MYADIPNPKPDAKKIREFVGRLRDLITERSRSETDSDCSMYKTSVSAGCGSPGCHGGWALMALPEGPQLTDSPASYYVEGAERLAKFLGMGSRRGLEKWAERHPLEWGGEDGGYMFSHPSAFKQMSSSFPASVLADWWERVADRLDLFSGAALTPGPWESNAGGFAVWTSDSERFIAATAWPYDGTSAEVPEVERGANARAIAVLPELVRAVASLGNDMAEFQRLYGGTTSINDLIALVERMLPPRKQEVKA